ncbi:hypothetical protein Ahy_B04g070634 isoform A [Arachis hypogaea]|uniref:Replication factor A C-terminal domain-containing protein n=1 Tax=Arachis hypogaea TaxID=3818 RepID=A0A444ZIC2_ARAHY|nr:hypothetical protein Ahy_B04g070634 isoform A [Arachis hypogaea]
MFASKLGFNLDIPEVASFQKSSIPHGVSASQPISIVGSGKNIEIEEDFMKLTPRCTVKSLDDNNRARTFIVLAKIAEIVEDGPWWYSACVCGRSVQAESGIYFCQFCNIHVTNVTPRLCLAHSLLLYSKKMLEKLCYSRFLVGLLGWRNSKGLIQ